MSEATDDQQRPAHLFKPGQSGNPAGRPKGSRNKLSEDFVATLYEDFQEHGAAAIRQCRENSPETYVRVIAGILPKEVKIERLDDMTDDDITKRIRQLAADLGVALGFIEGIGEASRGTEAPVRSH